MDWDDLTAEEARGGRVVTGVRLRQVNTFSQPSSWPAHPDPPALYDDGGHGGDQTAGCCPPL